MRGQPFKGSIVDYTSDGKRVVKAEGQPVIFTASGVLGDEVSGLVTGKHRGVLQGKVETTLIPSPHRIKPLLTPEHQYGGYDLMELDYEAQKGWKTSRLERELEKVGVKPEVIDPILAMDEPFHYRNHMQWQVQKGVMGFYGKGSHELIPLESSIIYSPLAQRVMDYLRNSSEIQRPDLRLIGIRTNTLGEAALIFVTTEPARFELAPKTVKDLQTLGVICCVQTVEKRQHLHYGEKTRTLFGKPHFQEQVKNQLFSFSPTGFFQTNTAILEAIIGYLQKHFPKSAPLVDLYCGVGVLGLMHDPKHLHYGVEYGKEAVAMAQRNSQAFNSPVDYLSGKAESCYDVIAKKLGQHHLILDPPRAGCNRKLIDAIKIHGPQHIAYVSCNPNTLARDLSLLADDYRIIRAVAADMFPWTVNVETVALMERR